MRLGLRGEVNATRWPNETPQLRQSSGRCLTGDEAIVTDQMNFNLGKLALGGLFPFRKELGMSKRTVCLLFVGAALLFTLVTGCSDKPAPAAVTPPPVPTAAPTATATPTPTETPAPVPTPAHTSKPTAAPEPTLVPTPAPTATPEPTLVPTPAPTATPEPTLVSTPAPAATPTPAPDPAGTSVTADRAALVGPVQRHRRSITGLTTPTG